MKKFFANQFALFVLSLFLAFILWLSVSGQNKSKLDLDVTIEPPKLSGDLHIEDDYPKKVSLRVEANMAQIRLLEPAKYSLQVNLTNASPGSHTIHLSEADLKPKLPRGVQEPKFIPEEITFNLYEIVNRTIPVKAEVMGELPNYLQMTGPLNIEPQEVTATGPTNRLDQLSVVPLTPIRLNEVTGPDSVLYLKPLAPNHENLLKFTPGLFKATVPVITLQDSQTFLLPIHLDAPIWNGPPVPLKMRPEQATLKVSWPKNKPAPLPDDFKLSVQLTLEELKGQGNLRPQIVGTSRLEWAKIESIEPSHLTISKVPRQDPLKP
ncbi:MAG: hypothetical protein LBR11_00480 [Deltaproteobacteria bacterium]|jgi:hypothetical protein|nr:hypothetical protein [Deltaproteobacteria bacterium]